MGTGSMMMIHNPWMRAEGESKDLRAAADLLDRVGESLVNVYAARTGKNRDELRELLNKTTWMTAEEAVAAGFADEVDNKFKVSASIQGVNAVFNDQRFELGIFAMAPSLPTVAATAPNTPEPSAVTTQEEEPKNQEQGDDTVKDLAELQAKHPEIYQAAIHAGATQERERIKGIDEVAANVADELVAKAKYEIPITVAELALQALKADAGKGIKHISDREQELQNNGNVKPGAQTPEQEKQQAEAAAIDLIAAAANQKQGRTEAK